MREIRWNHLAKEDFYNTIDDNTIELLRFWNSSQDDQRLKL